MKQIKVLGTGCAKCVNTAEAIQKVADEMGQNVEVTKETDPATIMSYAVMSTPAVVIDEKVVHTGSIPHREQIEAWFA